MDVTVNILDQQALSLKLVQQYKRRAQQQLQQRETTELLLWIFHYASIDLYIYVSTSKQSCYFEFFTMYL